MSSHTPPLPQPWQPLICSVSVDAPVLDISTACIKASFLAEAGRTVWMDQNFLILSPILWTFGLPPSLHFLKLYLTLFSYFSF